MKKQQITHIKTVDPTATDTIFNGYNVGQWWENTTTGAKFFHKTDGVWVEVGAGATGIPTLQQVTDAGATTLNQLRVERNNGDTSIEFFDLDNSIMSATIDVSQYPFTSYDSGNINNITALGFSAIYRRIAGNILTQSFVNEFGDLQVTALKTTSFTAVNSSSYTTNGTITITDPTPVTNKGFIVHVIGGTSTIGGVGYTSGALVYRYYNGTSWISKDYASNAITIDAVPTDGSTNAVRSDGVFDALATKQELLIDYHTKKALFFFEDFISEAYSNNSAGAVTFASGAGASASPNTTYPNRTNQQGVLRLATGTTATGFGHVRVGNNGGAPSLYLGGGEFTQELWVNIETLSDATNRFYNVFGFVGLQTANPTDAVAFVYDDGGASPQYGFGGTVSPNWKCYTSKNGSRTWTVTSIPVVASQWYKLKIVVNAAGTSVTYFIDGVSVATHTTTPTLVIQTCMNFKTVGTTSRNTFVDYIMLNQIYTTPRT